MSERITEFFELVADASIFDGAFAKAKASAVEFASAYKGSTNSVVADSVRMEAAMKSVRASSLAPGAGAESGAFYGHGASNVASTAAKDVSQAGGGMGIAGGGMGVFAILGLIGVGAGLLSWLSQAVSQYSAFSAGILRNSEAIGMNTQDLQTWDKIASVVGIDANGMALDFERFGKNLNNGAPALKATGLSLKDLGITTSDVSKAILQLSDYFHTHSDQAQKAAIAQALFGRSGSELIPILDQGSAAFKNYQAELAKMGVLLSNSQLFAGAQAQVAIQQFSSAFDAAKDRFLSAVLPGFTLFFGQLTTIIENNMPLWQHLGELVGQVVMFIAGVLSGLTGTKLDLGAPATDASAAYQGLGASAADAASQVGGLGGSTKSLTDAITDQINALQDEKRAQDELYDAQKSALQDQLDKLHDVTDSRRHQGEDIVTYERRLHELSLSDQIKAIDKQKTLYDRTVDDHIAALQREQQAVKEAAGGMGSSLSSGIGAGMNAGVAASAQAVSKVEKQWSDAGERLGKWLVTYLNNPGVAMQQAADTFGRLIGSAIVQGVESEAGQQLTSWLSGSTSNPERGRGRQYAAHAAGTITSGPEFAMIGEGGTEVVLPTYDRSRSLSLMEQSGMAALARSAGGTQGRNAPDSLVVNIQNMYAADQNEALRVIREIQAEARRRGFANSRGFG